MKIRVSFINPALTPVILDVPDGFDTWKYEAQADFIEHRVKHWDEWKPVEIVELTPDPYTLMLALSQVRPAPMQDEK